MKLQDTMYVPLTFLLGTNNTNTKLVSSLKIAHFYLGMYLDFDYGYYYLEIHVVLQTNKKTILGTCDKYYILKFCEL